MAPVNTTTLPLLRSPRLDDGKAVHRLIRNSPPLDLNSSYNYFLLCSHFVDTCVVGERCGRIVSFLSAYRKPREMDCLFVWQVAVERSLRGQGVAGLMLQHVLDRPSSDGIRYIETTVSPSNKASRRVFERLGGRFRADWHEEVFIGRDLFDDETHEEEVLFRVGPLGPHHEPKR